MIPRAYHKNSLFLFNITNVLKVKFHYESHLRTICARGGNGWELMMSIKNNPNTPSAKLILSAREARNYQASFLIKVAASSNNCMNNGRDLSSCLVLGFNLQNLIPQCYKYSSTIILKTNK
jgi:hypothetical protein